MTEGAAVGFEQSRKRLEETHEMAREAIERWCELADDPDAEEGEVRDALRSTTRIIDLLLTTLAAQHIVILDIRRESRIVFALVVVSILSTLAAWWWL